MNVDEYMTQSDVTDRQSEIGAFLRLSTVLTAFNEVSLWGTGLVDVYFDTVKARVEEAVLKDLFAVWEQEVSSSDDQAEAIRQHILGHEAYGDIARNIIRMWYIGQWDNNSVISGEAYQQGLVWDAINAHPQGAKQEGFGSWGFPPRTGLAPGAGS